MGRAWFPRDCNLTADPKVGLLGAEFGAEGVLAFEELLALAKLAGQGGRAETAYGQLASRALVRSPRRAGLIVERMEAVGLVQVAQANGTGLHYRLPRWTRWNDPGVARRQAEKRARDRKEVT